MGKEKQGSQELECKCAMAPWQICKDLPAEKLKKLLVCSCSPSAEFPPVNKSYVKSGNGVNGELRLPGSMGSGAVPECEEVMNIPAEARANCNEGNFLFSLHGRIKIF